MHSQSLLCRLDDPFEHLLTNRPLLCPDLFWNLKGIQSHEQAEIQLQVLFRHCATKSIVPWRWFHKLKWRKSAVDKVGSSRVLCHLPPSLCNYNSGPNAGKCAYVVRDETLSVNNLRIHARHCVSTWHLTLQMWCTMLSCFVFSFARSCLLTYLDFVNLVKSPTSAPGKWRCWSHTLSCLSAQPTLPICGHGVANSAKNTGGQCTLISGMCLR